MTMLQGPSYDNKQPEKEKFSSKLEKKDIWMMFIQQSNES